MRAFKIFRFGGFLFREFYPYLIKIINKGNELVYPKIMEVFSAIDLSSNKFNGNIPEFVGNFSGFQLRILNLSNNNFTGYIPSSLGNLTTLKSLDLSQNKLSEQIPEQLKQLTFLESFNVSNNQLTGPIPHGEQFNTFDSNSFEENLGLCGIQLKKKCEDLEPSPLPTSSIGDGQNSWFHIEFDWKIIILGYGSGLVFGVVLGNIVGKKNQHWFVKIKKLQHKMWKRQHV